ncbi:MAG: response regulator [Candidatus Margulisiibacteriota bacterium]
MKKILIVDDEKDLVEIIRLGLEPLGYQVFEAYDGQEGLEKARQIKPDLLILDLMLPKLDGYQVCRMLKFDVNYKEIPVILLTARAAEKDIAMGQEAGADAFITKPFKHEVLKEKIVELLREN